MIVSNTVLQVFPNINTTKTSCELVKTRKWVIGTLSIISHIINVRIATRTFNKEWSSSTAVFVSVRDNASALLSPNA